MYALKCFNDFNSIKVQLKLVDTDAVRQRSAPFQFHKGTIKTHSKYFN